MSLVVRIRGPFRVFPDSIGQRSFRYDTHPARLSFRHGEHNRFLGVSRVAAVSDKTNLAGITGFVQGIDYLTGPKHRC